jgi:hypothetical protein
MNILFSSFRGLDKGPDQYPDSKTAKKYTYGPKSEATEILKYMWLLHSPTKLRLGHL